MAPKSFALIDCFVYDYNTESQLDVGLFGCFSHAVSKALSLHSWRTRLI